MRKILLKEHKKLKILLIVLKQYSFFLMYMVTVTNIVSIIKTKHKKKNVKF